MASSERARTPFRRRRPEWPEPRETAALDCHGAVRLRFFTKLRLMSWIPSGFLTGALCAAKACPPATARRKEWGKTGRRRGRRLQQQGPGQPAGKGTCSNLVRRRVVRLKQTAGSSSRLFWRRFRACLTTQPTGRHCRPGRCFDTERVMVYPCGCSLARGT